MPDALCLSGLQNRSVRPDKTRQRRIRRYIPDVATYDEIRNTLRSSAVRL